MRPFTMAMLAILLLTRAAFAEWPAEVDSSLGCARNPHVVEACFQVHGRIDRSTNSFQMWWVGTKRYFFLVPPENPIAPTNVIRHLDLHRTIYGDFLICPFRRDIPGWLRPVCIQEASNLVIEDPDSVESWEPPKLIIERAKGSVPLTAP